MTCIVAVESENGAWLGTDSFLGDDSFRATLDHPKWFVKGDVLFAYAGDVRAAQLTEHGPKFRYQKKTETDEEYLVNVVAKRVRQTHIELHDDLASDNKEKNAPEVDYIMLYRGRVYTMQEGYAVYRLQEGYAAVGFGDKMAIAALAALKGLVEGEEWILRALGAVTKHSTGVTEPFHTKFMPKVPVRATKKK